MRRINRKCFSVKVDKEVSMFREVRREIFKPTDSGFCHYRNSSEFGKGEGEFGELLNYDFFKEGSLVKTHENLSAIISNKHFYGESIEDIEKEIADIVNLDIEISLTDFLNKWGKGRKKEDLLKIYVNSIENYNIEITELNYIVLENNSISEFIKIVNCHLNHGWKVLGGMQVSRAGGGESPHSWADNYYLQSLTNK